MRTSVRVRSGWSKMEKLRRSPGPRVRCCCQAARWRAAVAEREGLGLAAGAERERAAEGHAADPASEAILERVVRREVENGAGEVAASVAQQVQLRPGSGGVGPAAAGEPDHLRQVLTQQDGFGDI